jgi:D-serine deaminase-like pyridoxal phosphate-dependent protein
MLRLAGVSFYEGVVAGDTLLERQTGVRAMTNMTREIVERLAPLFERSGISEIVVSGGGSMYPDVVADEFGRPWAASHPVRPVMRSGAYRHARPRPLRATLALRHARRSRGPQARASDRGLGSGPIRT